MYADVERLLAISRFGNLIPAKVFLFHHRFIGNAFSMESDLPPGCPHAGKSKQRGKKNNKAQQGRLKLVGIKIDSHSNGEYDQKRNGRSNSPRPTVFKSALGRRWKHENTSVGGVHRRTQNAAVVKGFCWSVILLRPGITECWRQSAHWFSPHAIPARNAR